jgi:hypothetical protein
MAGPTYTYTEDTPQASNPMNNTAPVIRENFQAINELVAVNHVGFNSSDAGKHNYVSLEFQTDEPAVQSSQLTLYCQATGSPNAAEIFYTYPANSSEDQLTDQDVVVTGTGTSYGTASQGYCTFPSGIFMRWGQAALKGTSNTTITFTLGTPIYSTQILASAATPTTTGCNSPIGVQINGYINTTNMLPVNYGVNPASSSTTCTINYFLMGS